LYERFGGEVVGVWGGVGGGWGGVGGGDRLVGVRKAIVAREWER